MYQPDQEPGIHSNEQEPDPSVGSVAVCTVHGDLLSGVNARKIITNTYIENQSVTISQEQIAGIVAKLNAVQDIVWDGRMPYVGLKPFSEERAHLFFGRSTLIKKVASRIEHSSFFCITGPSGSGKSSFLHAGLIPKLKEGLVSESELWHFVSISPKSEPFVQLAAELSKISNEVIKANEVNNAETLLKYVNLLLERTRYKRLVLCIDQFEELFTQTKENTLRQDFAQLLVDVATDSDSLIKVVLTVRADFFADCLELPGYLSQIRENLEIIGPMTIEELSEAIIRPASEVGASLDDSLVTCLILDSKGDPGALPLMQFALDKLFRACTIGEGKEAGAKIALTVADYEKQGTIDQIIQIHADSALRDIRKRILDKFQPEQAEQILSFFFSQFVEVGQGRADTRRIAAYSDLVPIGIDPNSIDEMVTSLSAEETRLLTVDAAIQPDKLGDPKEYSSGFTDATVTLTHETLIDFWPWLRTLIDRERKLINLQDEIRKAAAGWQKNNRNPEDLYADARLNFVIQQLKTGERALNQQSSEFIKASQHRSRRRRFSRVGLATLLTVLFFPGLFVGANLWMFQRRANSNWQPIAGFPSHVVIAVTVAADTAKGVGPKACVGTNHIGIGCTDDYVTWNLYQSGLPTGSSAVIDSKDRFWGAMLGSVWSGQVRAVFDLAIDPMNSSRIVAFVREEGLYESLDSGVHWNQLKLESFPPNFPTAGTSRLYVEDRHIFVASGVEGPENQQGHLFISSDGGESFPIELASADSGKINDFFVIRNNSLEMFELYFVSQKGLYQAQQSENWNAQLLFESPASNEYIWIFNNGSSGELYIVTYDDDRNWSNLVRWNVIEKKLETWGNGYAGAILDLAFNPDDDMPGIAWALFEGGRVISIDHEGQITEQGSRPGWLWSQAHIIWFATDFESGGAYVPYLGHADGILRCPKCVTK